MTRIANGALRRSVRAITGRRAAASLSSPTFSPSSSAGASATPCGSRPTCITRRAHYFDPNKAAFQDFDPFWEFVSGPIHAGTGFQNAIDLTFGPQVVYVKARPHDPAVLGGPADGLQFF